jgi:hypothetical protein
MLGIADIDEQEPGSSATTTYSAKTARPFHGARDPLTLTVVKICVPAFTGR